MAHRVVERRDAIEIFRIHDVLRARLVGRVLAEILAERPRRAAKQAAESKRGMHSQSIDPSMSTSATVSVSPMTA
jgi:hypothetical protein